MPAPVDQPRAPHEARALIIMVAALALAWLHGVQCAAGLVSPAVAATGTAITAVSHTPEVVDVAQRGAPGSDLAVAVDVADGPDHGSGTARTVGACLLLLVLAFLLVNRETRGYAADDPRPGPRPGARPRPSRPALSQLGILRT
ncbi:hypothetical protein OG792_34380 [Micromonospora sp. NBC_01699]|uniref:hypothetical protein n=1 Tax=Micromonospora sp. NBC_01699 TaxID=2975984 RepID=UPI002E2CFE2E|nr:hypothetical protein [Micromonospora sp. NBC_01699]